MTDYRRGVRNGMILAFIFDMAWSYLFDAIEWVVNLWR